MLPIDLHMIRPLEEENIHDIDEYKLNPETMEKLKDSWKTLQER